MIVFTCRTPNTIPFRSLALIACLAIHLFNNPTTFSQESPESHGDVKSTPPGIFTTRTDATTLSLPDSQPSFQFAIFGDRTSGVPAGLRVLEQAVSDTNVIGPDLVMTVGDLVQGYNKTDQWLKQKDEYKAIMEELNCRWYPVAGNHDVYWDQGASDAPPGQHEQNYEQHFGPLWYSFQHKDSGFLILYSDEGDRETNRKGFREGRLQTMSEEQLSFLRQALKELSSCQHVFVFLHHPRWIGGGYEGGNWETVHQTMKEAGNVAAVFAGHIHHMRYDGKRDDIDYYALATTGGNLSHDFPGAGFLHHFNLVTVRPQGIDVATIPVGTVIDPQTFSQQYLAELDQVRQMRAVRIGKRVPLKNDGTALGSYEVRLENPSTRYPLQLEVTPQLPVRWQAFPSLRKLELEPGSSSTVSFKFQRDIGNQLVDTDPLGQDFDVPVLQIQTQMLVDDRQIHLPLDQHVLEMGLADSFADAEVDRCLVLENLGTNQPQGIAVADSQFQLPQGPFTLEAWVNPTNNNRSRGIVAKTQSSEYAIFSHDGRASFDVHLDGKYATARATDQLPLNQWTHVAGVYDGTSVRLYLNGKLVDQQPGQGTRTINRLPLYLGADPNGGGAATRSFAGKIDEVRLSTGIRYADDFQPAQRHSPDGQTVLLFHLDQQLGPFHLERRDGLLCRPIGNPALAERN